MLWEVARHRDGHLRFRFVEEASRTSKTSRQLRARAALALHAAVGLDSDRRDQVEGLLLARLDDPTLEQAQKLDLALAASAWEALSVAGSRRTARELGQEMSRTKGSAAPAQCLSMVAVRLEPREAVALLTWALKETSDPKAVSFLAQGLSQVAGRLDPKEAATATAPAAAALTRAIGETKDKNPSGLNSMNEPGNSLKQGLSAVAARLGPEDTAKAVAALTRVMTETSNPETLSSLAKLLSLVAVRLDPKEAATATAPATAVFGRAMMETKNNKDPLAALALRPLGEGLSALVTCLDSKDAAAAIAPVVVASPSPGPSRRPTTRDPCSGLNGGARPDAIGPHLDPKDAAEAVAVSSTRLSRLKRIGNKWISYWWWPCRLWRIAWTPRRPPLQPR